MPDDVSELGIVDPLDVVVEVGGAGLCRTDLHIIVGQWADKSNVAQPTTKYDPSAAARRLLSERYGPRNH